MKKAFICFLSLLMGTSAFAQEEGLTVKSFEDVSTVKQYARRADTPKDGNGIPAALVLVQVLSEAKIDFEGNYKMKNVEVKQIANEYWVYMAEGAKNLEVSHPRYPKIKVVFGEVSGHKIESLVSKCTYELVISVPEMDTVVIRDTIMETYEDRLNHARMMYNGWKNTTDPEYFLKARKAYEALMSHSECPKEALGVYQQEYDDMRFMRKYTQLCHKAWSLADAMEIKYGYEHDSTYHWLIMAVKQTDKLVKKYPGGRFESMQAEAIAKRNAHPHAKELVNTQVNVQRNSAYGEVFQKTEYIPYNQLGIYATKVARPKKDDEKQRIGTVKSDRTYKVVLPDGFDYIIFDGEKEGHLISTSDQKVDVFIK
mgnify:CR=1 FL=1